MLTIALLTNMINYKYVTNIRWQFTFVSFMLEIAKCRITN